MGSVNGTPHKEKKMSANKDTIPTTPKRTHSTRYPLSSPYSGKSPLPMPILLPSQYSIGKSSDRPSSGRFADSGLTTGNRRHYGPSDSKRPVGGVATDDDIEELEKRIELFDKSVTREQPEIPPVGSSLEDMPFFDKHRSSEYVSALRGIHKQTGSLKKINDTVVDLNESLGAYLFGLFQNAWCVNLNENVTPATLVKLEEVKRLKGQVAELEKQVELVKRNAIVREQRRKSTMPPPSLSRFQNSSTRKPDSRVARPARTVEKGNVSKPHPRGRTFLRAGSRNATFMARATTNRSAKSTQLQGKTSYGKGLDLSYATKIQNVPSLEDNSMSESSENDTSEVKTLTNIMRLRETNLPKRDDFRSRVKSSNNGPQRRTKEASEFPRQQKGSESWEVRHRKPFR
ncbi:hypothetical protein PICMEDRAFT_73146 [Pichia membranifaciens NRRL Y-2026]|uniref:Uncharacterized protein n=1 Tax=Pichia membranifaciens NRRL Y-2026 TaxID=763406 RepID=A0A1E3NHK3_9ASCO|nr:hypothetical protein PICMEDRAFT_73146 [Pichia membranifaciens NRRL Y-2026]ODQ45630.1 hypothetical protein PICMEDRAFT_73146 [Pichia membranifaciens NRRL Y-2026]